MWRGTKLTGWRKIATAMWQAPDDPQVFGTMEFDATGLRAFIHRARQAGHRITPTHLVGRAVALGLRAVPELNVRIVGDRALPRSSVDVFFITAVEGGRDLSGVKIERADEKSVYEIASELSRRASAMKSGLDPELATSKRFMQVLPRPLLRVALRLGAWLTGDLGVGIPALGLHPSPFGSAMITSVGMFGLSYGFAPLAWMYRVPLLVLAGEIADKPVAIEGRVEVRPVLPLSATIDHRYADGWHIARMIQPVRAYLSAPEQYEPPPPGT